MTGRVPRGVTSPPQPLLKQSKCLKCAHLTAAAQCHDMCPYVDQRGGGALCTHSLCRRALSNSVSNDLSSQSTLTSNIVHCTWQRQGKPVSKIFGHITPHQYHKKHSSTTAAAGCCNQQAAQWSFTSAAVAPRLVRFQLLCTPTATRALWARGAAGLGAVAPIWVINRRMQQGVQLRTGATIR
jgi:hypothetical protein